VLKANDFSPSEYNRISINLIEAVGLEGFADAFPHQLSEGMRARVGLARALAIEPSILLFDEPFSHVDELTARNLRTEILSLWEKSKQTVIFVTHNPREAAILADHIHILSDKPTSITHSLLISIPRPRSPENMEVVEIIKEIYSLLDGRKEAADA
jgi:ABC-type nitrate/sulfonate/bicarbonate transport system ATPase subunit